MSVDGIKEATEENVRSIRIALAKIDVLVSANPDSPRNVKLRGLIISKTRYELFDVVGELADLPPETADDLKQEQADEPVPQPVPQPRADSVAVIIWAGTQLTNYQIGCLRAVYTGLSGQVQHGPTDALAQTLCNQVTLDGDPDVNAQMKGFMGGPDAVHQALDQEISHAKATDACLAILGNIAGQVLVYRPPNDCFIRFDLQQIPGNWQAYGRTENDPLIVPPLDFSKKIVFVTIGHGDPFGRTNFPLRNLLSQPEIADLLGPGSRGSTVFRIPLQCYPLKAVETWPGQGGAVSINNHDRSDDIEMTNWIRDNLESTVRQWLTRF
ncbi:MAG TPA: hypothetical protein VFI65_23340 [Streptosporangiaceae bacterium]|nr:hypothetical protein [Streptosporangiaceae bacterium]